MRRSGSNPDGMRGPDDALAMSRAIGSGEGFDWYYANAADREARQRTAITDGAYSKPWVYRFKDLHSWWSEPHHNRVGGIEAANADAVGGTVEADLVHRTGVPGG